MKNVSAPVAAVTLAAVLALAFIAYGIAYGEWPTLSGILGALAVLGLLGLLRFGIVLLSKWIVSTRRGDRDGKGR